MNKNNNLYLDDYSMEDIINKKRVEISDDNEEITDDKDTKPSFTMKPNYNSKGEKIVVFSINIPLKKNGLKIDILINDEMYKNIGKYLK
jgi:hypothetical protein